MPRWEHCSRCFRRLDLDGLHICAIPEPVKPKPASIPAADSKPEKKK